MTEPYVDLDEERTETRVRHFNVHRAWIMQRFRGVWLANVSDDFNGDETFDAFPNLAAAKRWCAEACGRKRLPWTVPSERDPAWRAAIRGEVVREYDPRDL